MTRALRAGLYARVSEDPDGTSRSPEQQAAAGHKAAQDHGWRITHEYSEPDRSASRFGTRPRPEWDRLRNDLRAGRFDIVILWEQSRGSRRLTGWSDFVDSCREHGVKIYVTSDDYLYDPASQRDWQSLIHEGITSVIESERISKRVKRNYADAYEVGRPMGRIPFGYARWYEPRPGGLRPIPHQAVHPEESEIVRAIIGKLAAGEPVSRIVTDLADRGVSTRAGGRWSRASVVALVMNGECYIAKRRVNGGPLLDCDWPALVDEGTFWAAHNVLSDPARKAQAEGRGGIRPGKVKHLLSYLAFCGKCGAPLAVTSRPLGGQRVQYYRCSSSKGGCAQAPVEWLDFLIESAVIRWCARPVPFEILTGAEDADAAAARAEAAAERDRLAEFEAAAIRGEIPAGSFARIAAGIESRIAELDERAAVVSAPPALRDLMARAEASGLTLDEREAELRGRWEAMPVGTRRSVVATLCAPTLAPGVRGVPVGLDKASLSRVKLNWKRGEPDA